MGYYTEAQFHDNLSQIIRFLSDHGVVPILTTYPMADTFNDGKPQTFNAVIRNIAADQNIPLMDVRAAAPRIRQSRHGTGRLSPLGARHRVHQLRRRSERLRAHPARTADAANAAGAGVLERRDPSLVRGTRSARERAPTLMTHPSLNPVCT